MRIIPDRRRLDLIELGIETNVLLGEGSTFATPYTAAEIDAAGPASSENQLAGGAWLQVLSTKDWTLGHALLDREERLGIWGSEISWHSKYAGLNAKIAALVARRHVGGKSAGGHALPDDLVARSQDKMAAIIGFQVAASLAHQPRTHILRNFGETIRIVVERPTDRPMVHGPGNRIQAKSRLHRYGVEWIGGAGGTPVAHGSALHYLTGLEGETDYVKNSALGYPLLNFKDRWVRILAAAHGTTRLTNVCGITEANRKRLRTYVRMNGDWPPGWDAIAECCSRWPKLMTRFLLEVYADGSRRMLMESTTNHNKTGATLARYRPTNGGLAELWFPGHYKSTGSLQAIAWQDGNWFSTERRYRPDLGAHFRIPRPDPGHMIWSMSYGPDGFREESRRA